MKLNDQILRKQLELAGLKNFEIKDISLIPNRIDAYGKPFLERDRLLLIYRRRLAGAKIHAPNTIAKEFLENAIINLEDLSDKEEICLWRITCDGKKKWGRSTEKRLIYISPFDEMGLSGS